jgi:transcription initiation factor TFIIIB Brf1 subunit/transcription initiation factor TFIIB
MVSISPEHQERITEAAADVAAAQSEVERALTEVTTNERADKKIISEVLRIAVQRLNDARAKLTRLIESP